MVVIGVDLDNTIIRYDALFHRLGLELGLLDASAPASKRWIRDHIRAGSEGDLGWQRLQALAYGKRIDEASLFDGVIEFFAEARRRGAATFVISHKTERASLGDPSISLRSCALALLERRGLLSQLVRGEADVFFADTRHEKCLEVGALGCTHFVDDLVETFHEPSFPAGVDKILFDPHGDEASEEGIVRVEDWASVVRHVFG